MQPSFTPKFKFIFPAPVMATDIHEVFPQLSPGIKVTDRKYLSLSGAFIVCHAATHFWAIGQFLSSQCSFIH